MLVSSCIVRILDLAVSVGSFSLHWAWLVLGNVKLVDVIPSQQGIVLFARSGARFVIIKCKRCGGVCSKLLLCNSELRVAVLYFGVLGAFLFLSSQF